MARQVVSSTAGILTAYSLKWARSKICKDDDFISSHSTFQGSYRRKLSSDMNHFLLKFECPRGQRSCVGQSLDTWRTFRSAPQQHVAVSQDRPRLVDWHEHSELLHYKEWVLRAENKLLLLFCQVDAVLNWHLMTYCYTCRWMHLSTHIREASICNRLQLTQNLRISQGAQKTSWSTKP